MSFLNVSTPVKNKFMKMILKTTLLLLLLTACKKEVASITSQDSLTNLTLEEATLTSFFNQIENMVLLLEFILSSDHVVALSVKLLLVLQVLNHLNKLLK